MGEETICGFPADHVVLGMTVKDLRTMIRDSFLLLVVFLVWALVGVFFDWAFDVRGQFAP